MAIAVRVTSHCSKYSFLLHPHRSPFQPFRTTPALQKPASVAKAYVGESSDPYRLLGVDRDASPQEIKKAYRRLALQFHPDVCKGEPCKLRFLQIMNAYEVLLDRRRHDEAPISLDYYTDGMMGVGDNAWEDWEEWMGWEGAGIRDYTSHINIYV